YTAYVNIRPSTIEGDSSDDPVSDPSGVVEVKISIQENPPGGNYFNDTTHTYGEEEEFFLYPSGLESWTYYINMTYSTTTWKDGTKYKIWSYAKDAAGNLDLSGDYFEFTVDLTTPDEGSVLS
ncbi:unnamed protein product, partial [marine sediment metagenome]